MTKTCFKCRKKKKIENFYKHPGMADGHLGKCKTCTKLDTAKRYATPQGRKKVRAYEAERFQRPERKAQLAEYQRRRRAMCPGKNRARTAVGNAVRDGRLLRLPCEECGNDKSQAHHSDYRKPLTVRWLCFKHHRELEHAQIVG